jgi:hypothetical protein
MSVLSPFLEPVLLEELLAHEVVVTPESRARVVEGIRVFLEENRERVAGLCAREEEAAERRNGTASLDLIVNEILPELAVMLGMS